MSDEEREAIDLLKNIDKQKCVMLECPVVKNNIERQLKIIELNRTIRKQSKEIEELKENNKNLEDELNKYIVKMSDEQYRRLVDIIRDEINKLWEDKTKAKIEELENYYRELYKQDNSPNEFLIGQDCLSKLSILQEVKQSLLEKE